MIGPTGEWNVSQAQIINHNSTSPKVVNQTPKATVPLRPKPKEAQKAQKAPTQIWRAQSTQSAQSTREPSPSPKPDPTKALADEKNHYTCALTPTTLRRLGSDTSTEVQIVGDATKWLLWLRDGRSIVLSVSCLCGAGVTPGSDEMGQAMVATEGGMTSESSEGWCDDESVVDSMVEALDSQNDSLCLPNSVSAEHSPLWVEPIAISYPSVMGNQQEHEDSTTQPKEPSDWVREKYQEFGEYLGASYEGYENEVMGLPRAIE